jgi:hypothetical protein
MLPLVPVDRGVPGLGGVAVRETTAVVQPSYRIARASLIKTAGVAVSVPIGVGVQMPADAISHVGKARTAAACAG